MVRSRRAAEGTELGRLLLDPQETAFVQLVDELAEPAPGEERSAREAVRQDEFTCAGCHLVVHASRLAEPGGPRCADCAAGDVTG